MTAQFPEWLIYEGEQVAMFSDPLGGYLRTSGKTLNFDSSHSARRRGYTGTWEIKDGRLYLVELSAITEVDGLVSYLGTLFPESPEEVFADWFTDTIRLPQGKMLEYVHHAYASTYERDLFIEFDKGVVTQTYTRENEVAPKHEPAPKERGWFSRLFGTG